MQQLNTAMTAQQKAEFELASSIVHLLSASYPGFAWSVCVDSNNGIAKIFEPSFMDSTVPYVLRLQEVLYCEKEMRRRVVKVGGEILERFFLPRTAMTVERAQEKVIMLPKNLQGVAKFDKQGIPNWIGQP